METTNLTHCWIKDFPHASMECWLHPSLKPKVGGFFFHRSPIVSKLYGEGHGTKSNSWGRHIFLASDLFVHNSHEMARYCYPTARNSKSLWPLCTGTSTTLTFCARTVIDWSMEQISSNGLQIDHPKKIIKLHKVFHASGLHNKNFHVCDAAMCCNRSQTLINSWSNLCKPKAFLDIDILVDT